MASAAGTALEEQELLTAAGLVEPAARAERAGLLAAAPLPPLQVAPSLLACDFARLADEADEVAPVVPMLHIDVMDGHYVPNLTLGPPVVRSLRAASDRRFDCHLMIADPRTYGTELAAAGAELITFHPEVDDDPLGTIERLRDAGAEVGVAVRPSQPLSLVDELLAQIDLLLVMTVEPGFGGQSFRHDMVPRIAEALADRVRHGHRYRIEVDGGVSAATVAACVAAGADTLVAGSAVFGPADRAAAVRELLELAARTRTALGVAAELTPVPAPERGR